MTRIMANAVYIAPLVLSKMGSMPNKLHDTLKLLNLCPGLYTLMQKAVMLNMCHVVKKFLVE
jgi:hypothetical protein